MAYNYDGTKKSFIEVFWEDFGEPAVFIGLIIVAMVAFVYFAIVCNECSEEEIAKCKTPTLISEIDGVRLYSICKPDTCGNSNNDKIYFSTKGEVKWSETEQQGKHTVQKDRETLNYGF